MKLTGRLCLAVPVLALGLAAALPSPAVIAEGGVRFPADMPPRNEFVIENRVAIPMRDGVNTYADVYRPAGDGRHPVLISSTPYSTERFPSAYEAPMYFAQRGYVVVIQDVRGRFDSEGAWTPFVHEARDGFDAQEWCGTQPWSTGKVGTSGASYLALTQWLAAPLRNRHLTAMAPRVGFSNLYHNWVYTGGAFQLGFNLRWGAVQMHTRTNQLQYLWMPPEQHYSTLFWHLPLLTGDERAGRVCEFYREWIRHPDDGPYWDRLGNVEKDYERIDVPAYGFGGWYDVRHSFVGACCAGFSLGPYSSRHPVTGSPFPGLTQYSGASPACSGAS